MSCTQLLPLTLHDALPIWRHGGQARSRDRSSRRRFLSADVAAISEHALVEASVAAARLDIAGDRHRLEHSPVRSARRSEEHTSELQSPVHIVCRLMLEKKK